MKLPLSLRAALAAIATALACVFGAALAQEPGQPADLFGPLPEPPTREQPVQPSVDPASPAHGVLQPPAEAFAPLPADGRGKPDWARALRERLIAPRSSVTGDAPLPLLDLDIVMKNTAQMPWVRFPHRAHTEWLACSNCHDALFVPRAGANPTTMTKIFQGQSCGTCHAGVAFTAMFTCERCHSEPQPGQKPWW